MIMTTGIIHCGGKHVMPVLLFLMLITVVFFSHFHTES